MICRLTAEERRKPVGPASWKKHLVCFFTPNKMPPDGGGRERKV